MGARRIAVSDLRWVTRDGTEIRLGDMTDSHLLNARRMLKRAAERARACLCWVEMSCARTVPLMLDPAEEAALAWESRALLCEAWAHAMGEEQELRRRAEIDRARRAVGAVLGSA